jgi:hypothetical protein
MPIDIDAEPEVPEPPVSPSYEQLTLRPNSNKNGF